MDIIAEKFMAFSQTWFAPLLLAVHSAMESSFLVGAHDIFLVALGLARPELVFLFAVFSATGSCIGGSVNYFVGRYGGRPILEKFVHSRMVDKAEDFFNKYGAWAVAIGGFTPMPFKLITLVCGISEVRYPTFIMISVVARFARFMLVASLIFYFGEDIRDTIHHSFSTFSIVLFGIGVVLYFIIKNINKRMHHEDQNSQAE